MLLLLGCKLGSFLNVDFYVRRIRYNIPYTDTLGLDKLSLDKVLG